MAEPNNNPDNINPEARGTVFPSLDGSAPGEQPSSADITGLVLNELIPKDDGLSYAQGSSLPSAPVVEGAQAPAEPETIAAGEIEPPTERKKRTAADRISQLTRRYRAEQEHSGELQGQLAQLAQIVEQQNQQISSLRGIPAPRPTAVDPSSDLFGTPGNAAQPAQNGQAPVSVDDITAAINRALGDYDKRVNERNANVSKIRAAQESSFEAACEEMPELRDARTRAYQVFQQVYNASPIRHIEDAPYQIALQVKGILASDDSPAPARRGPPAANLEQRKRQAATVVPRPAQTDVPQLNKATVQKAYAEVCQQLRNGDKTPDTYIRWRKLRALANKG